MVVSELAIAVEGAHAVARFRQVYRSDRHRSVDQKTLVLVAQADGWRIVEEMAGR